MSNRILIIGAGQLGSFIYKNINMNMNDLTILDYPDFDITDQDMIKKVVDEYDIIINAAAYTIVDKAESEQLKCFEINSMGPIMLASECIKKNKKLIHISSEVVYGSNDLNYVPLKETDEKNPTCVYSRSKKIADDYIENLNDDNVLILRSGWLFGPNNDHNFIEKMRQLLTTKDEIKVVDDQIGTMTYVGDILSATIAFINDIIPGDVYNIGCDGYVSRYEVTEFVKNEIKSNCIINKCDSSEFKRVADVAKNSCLDCSKIKKYIPEFSDWKEDVKNILK